MEESKRNLTNHAKWLGAAAVEPIHLAFLSTMSSPPKKVEYVLFDMDGAQIS